MNTNGSARAKIIRTASGVDPVRNHPEFVITSGDILRMIKADFRKIEESQKKYKIDHGEDPNTVPSIAPEIKITCTRMGKRFFPIFLILPGTVMPGRNTSIPAIFTDDSDNIAFMEKPYWLCIRRWCYDNKDKELFKSRNWKQSVGITSPKNMGQIMRYSTPRSAYYEKDGRQVPYVIVMLDNLRLFHRMLIDLDHPNETFSVFINNYHRIDNEHHEYELSREVRKKESDDYDMIKDVLRNCLK